MEQELIENLIRDLDLQIYLYYAEPKTNPQVTLSQKPILCAPVSLSSFAFLWLLNYILKSAGGNHLHLASMKG